MDAISSSSSFLPAFSRKSLKPFPTTKPTRPQTTAVKQHYSKLSQSARPKPSQLPVAVCNSLDDFLSNFIHGRRPLPPHMDPKYVLADNFAPVAELEPTECIVEEGPIPRCLDGAYIRNGPNPQFIPRTGNAYHLFDGDGMLQCIRLAGDGATFCARFVKTYKYVQERDAGTSPLFLSFVSGFDSLASLVARCAVFVVRVMTGQVNPLYGSGQANTNVALVNGTLMALTESDLPYAVRVTPEGDIDTLGRWDCDGKLSIAMTAHPKFDPRTRETFGFRYALLPPFLTMFRIRPDGTKSDDVGLLLSLECSSVVHDFAITDTYALFPDTQLVMNPSDMVFAGECPPLRYDAGKVPRVGVIPRYAKDDSELKWFETPGFNFLHSVNAWEEGDDVVVLVAANTVNIEDLLNSLDLIHQRVEMVRFDMKEGRILSRQPLSERNLDMGVINPSFLGRKNRYAYMAIGDPIPKFSGIVKLDFENAGDGDCVVASRSFGKECFGGEPFFVAKDDEIGGGDEDDGYVITYMHDEQTGVSRFLVMDAKSPNLDIVASVRLPQRVPHGFHGLFVKEKDLKKQKWSQSGGHRPGSSKVV